MDSKAFHKISYGLYFIGSAYEGKLNGQTANSVLQISSDPATVAISINKKNLTHEYIKNSKIFSVSILPKSVPLDVIGLFGFKSGRDTDKYQDVPFKKGNTGAPILLENIVGYIEAEVITSLEVETHTIFIGKVIDAQAISDEEPITYAYYQQVKKGSTPSNAPISVMNTKQETKSEVAKDNKMGKYKCTVCGYIYDPAQGDPDSGIAPGTAFKDIPEDWVCPVCGVSRDQFEAIND